MIRIKTHNMDAYSDDGTTEKSAALRSAQKDGLWNVLSRIKYARKCEWKKFPSTASTCSRAGSPHSVEYTSHQ